MVVDFVSAGVVIIVFTSIPNIFIHWDGGGGRGVGSSGSRRKFWFDISAVVIVACVWIKYRRNMV